MSQNDEKLETLPKELFQLDQADPHFSLYRVTQAKSADVPTFFLGLLVGGAPSGRGVNQRGKQCPPDTSHPSHRYRRSQIGNGLYR